MSQVTTRYDGRRRPVARTVWLTPQASIPSSDAVQNPPIAGGTNGAAGDPAVSYDANGNATNGLTTRWIYIDNLVFIANTTDGGQTYTYPVSVPQLAGSTVPACTVDLSGLLSATGLPLAPGEGTFGNFNGFSASGSAVVTVNPLGEISVSVADAAGRTIATGVYKQSGTGAAIITATLVRNDLLPPVSTGAVVETDRMVATSLASPQAFNTTKSYADGAGRVLQTFDALSNATLMKYDAGGNLVSVRDPNGVGWDAGATIGTYTGYDGLNRLTNRIDTQGDTSATGYNLNGNVTSTTDAKSHVTSFVFDARDRKLQQTDRLSGITTWAYDGNSNLLTMLDPDNHSAGKTTAWAYNARNQKVSETYPDNAPGASPPVHDVKAFDYNPIGRPGTVTNQNGETIAPAFDFADRLTSRTYTVSGGTTASFTDAFIYDNAGALAFGREPAIQ